MAVDCTAGLRCRYNTRLPHRSIACKVPLKNKKMDRLNLIDTEDMDTEKDTELISSLSASSFVLGIHRVCREKNHLSLSRQSLFWITAASKVSAFSVFLKIKFNLFLFARAFLNLHILVCFCCLGCFF